MRILNGELKISGRSTYYFDRKFELDIKKLSPYINCFKNSYQHNKNNMILGNDIWPGLHCDSTTLDPLQICCRSIQFTQVKRKFDFALERVYDKNWTDWNLYYSGTRMGLKWYRVIMVSWQVQKVSPIERKEVLTEGCLIIYLLLV